MTESRLIHRRCSGFLRSVLEVQCIMPENINCESFEPTFPLTRDVEFVEWQRELKRLSWSGLKIREADSSGEDGRKMKDLQVSCEPLGVLSILRNIETIATHRVLFVEECGVHVGFCVSSLEAECTDPIFIQTIGVVSEGQHRGIGVALLESATSREPNRDIALAAQKDNAGAFVLAKKFAMSIGASVQKVKLGTYADDYLGITRGIGYRILVIRRP